MEYVITPTKHYLLLFYFDQAFMQIWAPKLKNVYRQKSIYFWFDIINTSICPLLKLVSWSNIYGRVFMLRCASKILLRLFFFQILRGKHFCIQKYSHGIFLKTAALKILETANRKAVYRYSRNFIVAYVRVLTVSKQNIG